MAMQNLIVRMMGAALLVAVVVGCSEQEAGPAPATIKPVVVTPTAAATPDVNGCRDAMKAGYVDGWSDGRDFPPQAYGPACVGIDRTTLHRLADEIIDEAVDPTS